MNDTDRFRPEWVKALGELEEYATQRGWSWTELGHAGVIRKLLAERTIGGSKCHPCPEESCSACDDGNEAQPHAAFVGVVRA